MIRELGEGLQVGFLYIVIKDLHETLAHADHWCPCLPIPIILSVAYVLANISINLSLSLFFVVMASLGEAEGLPGRRCWRSRESVLGMQAGGLAPKVLLSVIARIKLCRTQGDAGRRPCVEDPFGTIRRDNLHMHRLMNQPSYFIISGRKMGTGPMAEASDAHTDRGPR
jgi:hypothetical protein